MVERDLYTALMLWRSNIERRRTHVYVRAYIIAGKLRTQPPLRSRFKLYGGCSRVALVREIASRLRSIAPSLFSEFLRRSATTRDMNNFSTCLWSLTLLCCARVDIALGHFSRKQRALINLINPRKERESFPLKPLEQNSYSDVHILFNYLQQLVGSDFYSFFDVTRVGVKNCKW